MSTDKEKGWEDLTLDEKLTELGFEANVMAPSRQADMDKRMHAALDQLLDAGETLNTIEELTKPTAEGNPTGDELNTCVTIHNLVTGKEEDEDTV